MAELKDFGVYIKPADVPVGQWYWKAVKVRILDPAENAGKHNIFITALDKDGHRARFPIYAGWEWEGMKPHEVARPVPLDKPLPVPFMGDIALHAGQKATVWMNGAPS